MVFPRRLHLYMSLPVDVLLRAASLLEQGTDRIRALRLVDHELADAVPRCPLAVAVRPHWCGAASCGPSPRLFATQPALCSPFPPQECAHERD